MKCGKTLAKAISALAIAGFLSGNALSENLGKSETSEIITLRNVKDHVTYKEEPNGMVRIEGPFISDYAQVKPLYDTLYNMLMDEAIGVYIEVIPKEEMGDKIKNSITIDPKKIPFAFRKVGETIDSVFVQPSDFKEFNNLLSHELGHASTKHRYKRLGELDGYIVEEAKAIAFTGAWNEALAEFLPSGTVDGKKTGLFFGIPKIESRTEMPLYACALDIVKALKKQEGTYTHAYLAILRSTNETVLSTIKDTDCYAKLKSGEIKSQYFTW